jgi:TolB protein
VQDGGYGLYVIQADGSGFERLAEESGPVSVPVWSPDAGRIAYVVASTFGLDTLRLYDFAAGAATTVAEGVAGGTTAPTVAWLEDGAGLAFINVSSGGIRIYDFETGAVDAAVIGANVRALDWSSGGRAAYIAGAPGDQPALLVAEDDESRELLRRDGLGGVRWSPDGEDGAFWALKPDTAPARRQLLVVDGDGGDPEELTEGEAPAWAPDGERIAYSGAAEAGPALDIHVIGSSGGEPRNVTLSVTDDRWPAWSPGGDRIVYLAIADAQTAFVCTVRLEPEEHDCFDLPGLLPTGAAWSPR